MSAALAPILSGGYEPQVFRGSPTYIFLASKPASRHFDACQNLRTPKAVDQTPAGMHEWVTGCRNYTRSNSKSGSSRAEKQKPLSPCLRHPQSLKPLPQIMSPLG